MFAAGIGLFTFGYALAWTGVQRFRKQDVTLLEALGMPNTGLVNRMQSVGPDNAQPPVPGSNPSPPGSGPTIQPATTGGISPTGGPII